MHTTPHPTTHPPTHCCCVQVCGPPSILAQFQALRLVCPKIRLRIMRVTLAGDLLVTPLPAPAATSSSKSSSRAGAASSADKAALTAAASSSSSSRRGDVLGAGQGGGGQQQVMKVQVLNEQTYFFPWWTR